MQVIKVLIRSYFSLILLGSSVALTGMVSAVAHPTGLGARAIVKPTAVSAAAPVVLGHYHGTPFQFGHLVRPPKQPLPRAAVRFQPHQLALAPFVGVAASGPIDVQMQGAPGPAKVVIQGDSRLFKAEVNQGVLNITVDPFMAKFAPKRTQVALKMPLLNQIKLAGSASFAGKQVRSQGLSVEDQSTGFLWLSGVIPLRHLARTGLGQVNIRWIDSPELDIRASSGQMHLAGVVEQLTAQLSGGSILDSKFLRAQHAWIKTCGRAKASVLALQDLHLFAHEQSTIDYYKKPDLLDSHTADKAVILQRQAWR